MRERRKEAGEKESKNHNCFLKNKKPNGLLSDSASAKQRLKLLF